MREGLSRTLMQGACALRLVPRGLRLAACGLRLCNTTTGCSLRLGACGLRLGLEPRRLWLVACALQLVVVFLQHNLRLHATWGCAFQVRGNAQKPRVHRQGLVLRTYPDQFYCIQSLVPRGFATSELHLGFGISFSNRPATINWSQIHCPATCTIANPLQWIWDQYNLRL